MIVSGDVGFGLRQNRARASGGHVKGGDGKRERRPGWGVMGTSKHPSSERLCLLASPATQLHLGGCRFAIPTRQAGRGRKGTAPHSLTYLPVVPTAHLIGKAFAGAESRRGGQVGGKWLCSSLGENSAARKEGGRTVQPSGGEKPGLVEKEGLWWGGESRTQGGPLSEQPPPPISAQPGKGSGEKSCHQETLCTASFLQQK